MQDMYSVNDVETELRWEEFLCSEYICVQFTQLNLTNKP